MYRIKLICLMIACFLGSEVLQAQTDDFVKDHIIVAFDKAGCDELLKKEETRMAVIDYLFKTGTVEKGTSLYNEGDMISVMGFCTDPMQNNMKGFSYGVNVPGENRLFLRSGMSVNLARSRFSQYNWDALISYKSPIIKDSHKKYSLVSVARPYCLKTAKIDSDKYNDKCLTNRTFIIMVTDHRYNGNSFYDEVLYIAEKHGKNVGMSMSAMYDRIFDVCHDVESDYYIKFITSTPIGGKYSGFVEVYEYVPHQSYLSLSSVVDYPSAIDAKRLPGKKYEIDVSFNKRENEHYRIKRLDVKMKFPDGRDSLKTFFDMDSIRFSKVFHRDSCPEKLEVRAWLRVMDGVYNSTILTPSASAADYLGGKGLNIALPVVLEPDAEVLGVPLPDWLWLGYDRNQYEAAMLMEFLAIAAIVLLLVIVVIILYFSFRYYKPDKDDMTIKYY